MSRLVALTVMMTLGTGPLTYAGEGLMETGSRIVQQQTSQSTERAPAANQAGVAEKSRAKNLAPSLFAAQQTGQTGVLSKSGMSTRTKMLIYLAAGAGLAVTAWEIDHNVLDVTPSSLGTRRDGCKPFCGSPSQ